MGNIKRKSPYVDLAKPEDLDDIMKVEVAAYGASMSASREIMEARIEMCNAKGSTSLLEGFMWVVRLKGEVIAHMTMQPFAVQPDECTSWEAATDNGTFETTWQDEGPNLYAVAIAAYEKAYAIGVADMLIMTAGQRFAKWKETHPESVCMFMARLTGLDRTCTREDITPEEYFSQRRSDGTHKDATVRWFEETSGNKATRLVENGYAPDKASRGYGALFVLPEPWNTVEAATQCTLHSMHQAGIRSVKEKKITPMKDPRAEPLFGGQRTVWDPVEQQWVNAAFAYKPDGCSWGKCTFCGFANAVDEYHSLAFDGKDIPSKVQISMFKDVLEYALRLAPDLHTLYVFNAGSLLGSECLSEVRNAVIAMVAERSIQHLIIESLPEFVTDELLQPIVEMLRKHGCRLTVLIGVETINHRLRNHHLVKGVTDSHIRKARAVTNLLGVQLVAYVMLAPGSDAMVRDVIGDPQATTDDIDAWNVSEAVATVASLLEQLPHGFGLDGCHLGATCVAPNTTLAALYAAGEFRVPTLSMLYQTLEELRVHGHLSQVELLPSVDHPEFLAVPSLDGKGVPQGYEEVDPYVEQCACYLEQFRTTRLSEVLEKLGKAVSAAG